MGRSLLGAIGLFVLLSGAGACRARKPSNRDPWAEEHRASAEACSERKRRPGVARKNSPGCHADSECSGSNARCEQIGIDVSNTCSADDCMADKDCTGQGPFGPTDAKGVCVCGTGDWGTNQCVYGDCRADGDCAQGAWCSISSDCGLSAGYFCHRSDDECRSAADCRDSGGYARCIFDAKKHWACTHQSCPVR